MVQYSPLCDTDRIAYFAYLVASTNHGTTLEFHREVCRITGNERCNCLSGDVVERVCGSRCGTVSSVESEVAGVCVDPDVACVVDGCRDFDGSRHPESSASGISGGVTGVSDGCGSDNIGPVDASERGVCDNADRARHADGETWPGPEVKPRGKHYLKNKAKREKRRRSAGVPVDTGLKYHAPRTEAGYFSACSDEMKHKLRESRAAMLVSTNLMREKKAQDAIKWSNMEQSSRVWDVKFEVGRLTAEQKLNNISKARLGSAQESVSISSSSGVNASVSPDSSISIAQEMKLRKDLKDAQDEVKELKILKDELACYKAGVPKGAQKRLSEWHEKPLSSLYDNFAPGGIHKSQLPDYVPDGKGAYKYNRRVNGGQGFQFSSYDH